MALYSDVLLTVDYDRTLTAPDSSIPERNLEAIRYFMENGGIFTVNTGRSVPMSRNHIIGKVPVNAPLLLYNGSADYDADTGVFKRCQAIDVDPKTFLLDIIDRFPMLNLEVQGEHGHYMLRKNEGWEGYCRHNNCTFGYVTPDDIPMPFIKVAINGEFRDCTVASMYQATEEDMRIFAELTDYVNQKYGDKVDGFRACPRILDIHAKGCSKLNAARLLQKELGRKILVCVGDSHNDLSMMEGADYAFCPSDGAIADRFPNVCPCAEGAVADVIYEKIPGLLKNKP